MRWVVCTGGGGQPGDECIADTVPHCNGPAVPGTTASDCTEPQSVHFVGGGSARAANASVRMAAVINAPLKGGLLTTTTAIGNWSIN